MSDKSDKKELLDLGFSNLLSGPSSSNAEPLEPAPLSPPIDEPLEPLLETSAPDAFETLWNDKKYPELIDLSEKVQPQDDNPLTRKLWWIRGQTARGELPKQVLCASLEECLSSETIDTVPPSLIDGTSLELGQKLKEADEEGLAIAVLEKCFLVLPSHEVGALLLGMVQEELVQLPKRATFHTPSEMKKRLHLLDLKRNLDEYLKHNTTGFEIGTLPEEPLSSDEILSPRITPAKIVQGQGARNALVYLFVFIAAMVALWFYAGKQFFYPEDQQLAGDILPQPSTEAKLESPQAAPVTDISQLAALMYDVEKNETPQPQSQPTPGAVQVSHPVPPVVATPAPKATIDTSGPVESDHVKQLIEGRDKSAYDDGPPVPRFPKDNDRDLSREPVRRDERDLDEDRRSDPDRGQTWSGGQRYEVMINTSVMDRPSFHASEVAELYVGDRVLVEARLGRWLRVRSVKGKPGYIMAQDAEKLFD